MQHPQAWTLADEDEFQLARRLQTAGNVMRLSAVLRDGFTAACAQCMMRGTPALCLSLSLMRLEWRRNPSGVQACALYSLLHLRSAAWHGARLPKSLSP